MTDTPTSAIPQSRTSANAPTGYEILAVRYASSRAPKARLYHQFDAYGEAHVDVGIDAFFWILRRGDQTVLVDTGTSPAGAAARSHKQLWAPLDALRALGIAPDSVSTVVVTHFHYDHIGNVAAFPSAEIVVPRRELLFWRSPVAAKHQFAWTVDAEAIGYIERSRDRGRVRETDGTEEILDGVTAISVGGHSPGQQVTVVSAAGGDVVLTSDAAHFYEELELERPFAVLTDLARCYEAFGLLKGLAHHPGATLVAGHDPDVMARFPAVPGAEGWAVQIA